MTSDHATSKPLTIIQKTLTMGTVIIPWLTLIFTAVYGYGVRTTTSDRVMQQQQEDHIALQLVKEKLSDLSTKQEGVAAKVDLIVAEMFRDKK